MNTTEELVWFKSSHSGGGGGECIEIAARPHAIHIRDSKQPEAAQLTTTPAGWTAFVAYACGASSD
ncbi:DUF397 domain-containing protein [Streptomyces sp. NPDC050418]|uniref:DUF397 domain-containing protein n=1 Tax=Streptomyces sp. NPDC050418 TaxID=3365612 RepID=UPI0037BD65BB